MKKLSKRIICIALSFVCIFMSTYTVYASTDTEGNWEHLSNGHVIVDGVEYEPLDQNQVWHEIYYLCNKLGIVGKIMTTTFDLTWAYEILSQSGRCVRGSDGTIYMRVDRKTEDGDNINFNSDYVNDVYNGLKNIIQTEDGYAFIPTVSVDCLKSHYFNQPEYYNNYVNFCNFVKSGNYFGELSFPGDYANGFLRLNYSLYDANVILYGDYTRASKPTSYGIYSVPYFLCQFIRDGFSADISFARGDTGDFGGSISFNRSASNIDLIINNDFRADYISTSGYVYKGIDFMFTSDGSPLKVYRSREAYIKYLDGHGVQNFYTSNTFNNYNVNNDNSITVNKKVYNDTDYVTINNNNYETINKTVNNYYEKNNSTIDTSSIEDIIKKFQEDQAKHDQEIIDKIDDGNEKADEGNQISKDTNEKLDKIYAILQRIADKIGESGDSGTSGSDFDMNTLIEMLNNLQLSLDTMWQVDVKDIQKKLGTIVDDLKSDNPDSKSILEDICKTQQQILELQQASYDQNKTFFDTVTDYLKKILHAVTLGDSLDIIDKLLNIKDDAESLTDFVDGLVGDFEPTVQLMKTKFPTSIPWDIIAVISVMSCEPQTPCFEIPIHVNMFGQEYDYTLVIDLEQFDRVAVFGRALLTIMFTLWLLLITKQLLYKGE